MGFKIVTLFLTRILGPRIGVYQELASEITHSYHGINGIPTPFQCVYTLVVQIAFSQPAHQ